MSALIRGCNFALLLILSSPAPLEAAVFVRLSTQEFAHQVEEIQGDVWLAMDSGAYRVYGNKLINISLNTSDPTLRQEENLPVLALAEVDGEVLLGTSEGLYLVRGRDAKPVPHSPLNKQAILNIEPDGPIAWIGSPGGLYSFEPRLGSPPTVSLKESVNIVKMIDGELWVGTSKNAYRLEADGEFKPVFPNQEAVGQIVKAGGSIWLTTLGVHSLPKHCYQLQGGVLTLLPPPAPKAKIISAAEVDGEAWFATTKGAFRLTAKGLKREFTAASEPVNTILKFDQEIWVGTTHTAYRKTVEGVTPMMLPEEDIEINRFIEIAGELWMWGATGVYRFDKNVDISVELNTHFLFGQEFLYKNILRVEGVRYDLDGQDPYERDLNGDFQLIIEHDVGQFEHDVGEMRFSHAGGLVHEMPYWFGQINILARDNFGNTHQPPTRQLLVIPPIAVLSVLLPVASLLLSLLILASAPWWKPAMTFLMFPAVRRVGSLWSILLALSFSSVRRYVLGYYRRQLYTSTLRYGWASQADYSATSLQVLKKLDEHNRLLLIGKPEENRRYLRRLASQLTSSRGTIPYHSRGFVPIFLRLELYAESKGKLEKGALAQLADFGGLTDSDLAMKFLGQGGFLFLLDGFEKLSEEEKKAVEEFSNAYRNQNLIIVSADARSASNELDGYEPVSLRSAK